MSKGGSIRHFVQVMLSLQKIPDYGVQWPELRHFKLFPARGKFSQRSLFTRVNKNSSQLRFTIPELVFAFLIFVSWASCPVDVKAEIP